jgi:beta-xylosidase
VDTPDGEWWFLHFQQFNPIGRVVHLQPMYWHDDWPVIGVDMDRNGIGEPVLAWRKPGHKIAQSNIDLEGIYEKDDNICIPAHSDRFDSPELGLQWQFNHNPVDGEWSLTERKGWLTLNALKGESFRMARNTFTQKSMGYIGEFTVKIDVSSLIDNDFAGVACMGWENHQIGVMKKDGKLIIYTGSDENEIQTTVPTSKKIVYLRLNLDGITNCYSFSYSIDNKVFTHIGDSFTMDFGHWKGVHAAIFCYNTEGKGGKAFFDWADYNIKDNIIKYVSR